MAQFKLHIRARSGGEKQVQSALGLPIKVPATQEASYQLTDAQDTPLTQVRFSRQGQDLVVQDPVTGEHIVIENYYTVCSISNCQWEGASAGNPWAGAEANTPAPEALALGQEAVYQWQSSADRSTGTGALLPLVASGNLLSVMGGVGVLALAGGGSGGGNSPSPVAYTISGQFAAGPVLDSASVVVDIYRNGVLYKAGVPVDASGRYNWTISDGKGGTIVVRARDADGELSPDYYGETGQIKNLDVDLRAAAVATDGTALILNVNPLTELAVRKMAGAGNAVPAGIDIAAVNKAMAALWGLGNNFDITQKTPALIINASGQRQTGDAYGKVLALLDGLTEVKGGMEQSLIAASTAVTSNAGAWVNSELLALLAEAVKKVSTLSNDDIPASLKALDTMLPVTNSVTVSGHASNGSAKSGTLIAGDLIHITLQLSEIVQVSGTPSLALTLGGSAIQANYLSGTNTNTLVFEYKIQAGDAANALLVPSLLTAPLASQIKDLAGNTLATALPQAVGGGDIRADAAPPSPPQLQLTVDTGNGSAGSQADGLTRDGRFTISGLESGASWEYSTDGGVHWSAGSGTIQSLSGEGQKTVIARQIDAAGNKSANSQPLSFVLDTQAPDGLWIDPVGDNNTVNVFHQQAGLTLSGTAHAGATVHIAWGSSQWTREALSDGQGQGRWQIQLTAEEVQALNSTQISASVTDLAGNAALATRSLTFSDAPIISKIYDSTLASTTDDGYINAAERNNGVTVTGYALPGKLVQVFIEGRNGDSLSTTADPNSGQWSVTFESYTLPSPDDSSLNVNTPLSSLFTVVMLDGSNLAGSKSQIFDIGVATQWEATMGAQYFPNLTTYPVVNQAVINGGGATIQGTTEAGSKVLLYWNGLTTPIGPAITADANGHWAYVLLPSSFIGLPDGQHTLHYVITDVAGNSAQQSQNVIIANVAPSGMTINDYVQGAPTNTVNLAAKTGAVITFSGEAPNADRVTISWAGMTPQSQTFAQGHWTAIFNSTPADAANTTLTLTAFDVYNNHSSTSKSITVDTTVLAPTVNPVGQANQINYDQIHAAAGIVLSGMAEPNATVSIVWGTYQNNAITVGSDGLWTWTIPQSQAIAALNNNTGPLYVTQTDVARNTSSQTTVNVVIDVLKPEAPIIAYVSTTDVDIDGNEISVDILPSGYVNKNMSAHAITLTGTAEENSIVSVTWGGISRSAVTEPGQIDWSITFLPDEIPSDNSTDGAGTPYPLTVTTIDAVGNISPAVTHNFVVDTTPPLKPTIGMAGVTMTVDGESYDVVNWNNAKDGVTLHGTGTKGAQIKVKWGDTLQTTVTVDPNTGEWTLPVAYDQIPGYAANAEMSSVNNGANAVYPLTAHQLDAAGNTSAIVQRAVLVGWTTTAVSLEPTTGDGYINKAEYLAADGSKAEIALRGLAEPHASVRIQWGTLDKTVTADDEGAWTYYLKQSEIPSGAAQTPLTLTATDDIGNVTSIVTANSTSDGINQTPIVVLDSPVITQIVADKTSANADTESIVFTVNFNKYIKPESVSTASFLANYGTVTEVNLVEGSGNTQYTVTVTPTDGHDAGSEIYLSVANVTSNLLDEASNPVVSGSLFDKRRVPLDNVLPSFIAATDTISDTANVSHTAFDVSLTLNEPLNGILQTSDFQATLGTVTNVTRVDSTHYTVRISPDAAVQSGNITLQLLGTSGLKDAANNPLQGVDLSSLWSQALDNVAPLVSTVTNNVNNKANSDTSKIDFSVSFDEALSSNVSTSNFTASHGNVTKVTKIDARHYTVEVTPHANVASGSVALQLVGTGLTDAAGNPVANADLGSKNSVTLDNVAPATPLLTFNGSTTYTDPRQPAAIKQVDFIANSSNSFNNTDANIVSTPEFSTNGFNISGLTETNSLVKLVWQYTQNGALKTITIDDSSIQYNGNAWSFNFDSTHLPPSQGTSKFSTFSMYAIDAAGNVSAPWTKSISLDYVI